MCNIQSEGAEWSVRAVGCWLVDGVLIEGSVVKNVRNVMYAAQRRAWTTDHTLCNETQMGPCLSSFCVCTLTEEVLSDLQGLCDWSCRGKLSHHWQLPPNGKQYERPNPKISVICHTSQGQRSKVKDFCNCVGPNCSVWTFISSFVIL